MPPRQFAQIAEIRAGCEKKGLFKGKDYKLAV